MRFLIASHRPGPHPVIRRDPDFMLEAARCLIDHGHEVWMLYHGELSPRGRSIHERLDIPFVEFKGNLKRLSAVWSLVRVIRRLRIDATVAQWESNYTLSIAALICRVSRRILRVNSFPWFEQRPSILSVLRNRLLYSLLAHEVVTCSDALSDNLAERFKIRRGEVHTVHPGIRIPEEIPEVHAEVPSGHVDAHPVVVSVAVLFPHKGHLELLRALPQVVDRHPGVRFRFVGGGPLLERLEREAARLGIAEQVEFLGSAPVDQVLDHFRGASLAILSSKSEAFGYVLLEAMVCGTPVVASAAGGIPEVVADNESGLLVKLGQSDDFAASINRILGDTSLAHSMGRAGRARVRSNFDIRLRGKALAGVLATGDVHAFSPR